MRSSGARPMPALTAAPTEPARSRLPSTVTVPLDGLRAPYTASIDTLVGTLSGGNQQKVVLAKWLSMKPRVVIFDEPTRGIDVGSKSEIYKLMRSLADAGVAVLMISSDMEEVIGVSDRIAVMREGRIAWFLTRNKFSEESVMRLAVGRRDLQEAEAVAS